MRRQLDEMLYKQLEQIRKDLDYYILEKTLPPVAVCKCSSMPSMASRMADEEMPRAPRSAGGAEFLSRAECRPGLDQFLEKKEETFSTMLLRLIDEKGLKDSEVYKQANIDRRLFSKIRGDEDYVPSKKTAIAFCLALQLELKEAKKLLKTAGYTLSASSRFDLIIMYLIEHCEYNIHFANIVLDDYGEGTLSR